MVATAPIIVAVSASPHHSYGHHPVPGEAAAAVFILALTVFTVLGFLLWSIRQ
jgi:hypothetical protein